MAAAAPAAMAAGGAVSAYGALQQGKMTSQSLGAQAAVQERQAQEALDAGNYDAVRQQLISSQKIGTATAAYGASGVSTNSGSAIDVLSASAANAEMDRQNILYGADIKAVNYENQASLDRYGASSAITASYWNALSDVTGGLVKGISGATSGAGATPRSSGEEATNLTDTGNTSVSGEAAGNSAGQAAMAGDVIG